jgi:DNA-binding CsgD family transcriptional regulator
MGHPNTEPITCVVEIHAPSKVRGVVTLRGAEGRSLLAALLAAGSEITVRDGPAAPVGWERLTPAERAVVRAVGEGATNAQAATQLFVSPHTVAAHLRSIYSKLEIGSRIELVRLVSSGRID